MSPSTRRTMTLLTTPLVLLGALAAHSAALAAPNIVVIMTDDLSESTLKDGIVKGWMPNLKLSIIDQGVSFDNFVVADAVCGPSRATFLTGQHTHNHGVLNNVVGVVGLDDSSTLATSLQAAGYRNALVGKYINGYGSNLSPSPVDDPTYIPPGWDEWNVLLSGQMYNYPMNDNGIIVNYGSQPSDYATDVLATRAAAFIQESDAHNDAQPFFLWIATGAPHALIGTICPINYGNMGPYAPAARHSGVADGLPLPMSPAFNESNVADKPSWLRNNYSLLTSAHVNCLKRIHRGRVETMMAVDDLIGTVVSELQATAELNNTILVFLSDHGFLLGEHRASTKQMPYEESIGAPLYMKGPGIAVGQTAQQMVGNTDLFPTFLEWAGATASHVADGASLVPVLQNPGYSPWRNYFLIEHTKVITTPVLDYSAVRSPQFTWVEYTNGERELYDRVADPHELTSQHANPAYGSAKDLLRKALNNKLKACAGVNCWQ